MDNPYIRTDINASLYPEVRCFLMLGPTGGLRRHLWIMYKETGVFINNQRNRLDTSSRTTATLAEETRDFNRGLVGEITLDEALYELKDWAEGPKKVIEYLNKRKLEEKNMTDSTEFVGVHRPSNYDIDMAELWRICKKQNVPLPLIVIQWAENKNPHVIKEKEVDISGSVSTTDDGHVISMTSLPKEVTHIIVKDATK